MGLWGAGSFTIGPAQQSRLMTLNPKLTTVSLGFNTASVYAGMAIGSLIGGALIAGIGIGSLNLAAIALLLLAYVALYLGAKVRVR